MRLLSLSKKGDEYLAKLKRFDQTKNIYIKMDLERVKKCDYEVILITDDELDSQRIKMYGLDENLISCLHNAWAPVRDHEDAHKQNDELGMQTIKKECVPLINTVHEKGFYLRRVRSDLFTRRAFLFLGLNPWFPLDSLFMLSRTCQVEQELIPLHMSAVVYQGYLYLFGGPSGAGKSTVANFIIKQGGYLLDEDQVNVRRNSDGTYSAGAWGYSLQNCDAPIRAVFQLKKDDHIALIPLSDLQAAVFLMAQSEQVCGWMLHDVQFQQLFTNVAEMARNVPTYELHFQRNDHFWPLILKHLDA